ncbi:MAG: MotA/TolQ/ExbB proton channel family protein [Planctomycetales bacterium]|nr:MotA/TolQ/ExbB proton channel family protein [Planctomycetales bacterium]
MSRSVRLPYFTTGLRLLVMVAALLMLSRGISMAQSSAPADSDAVSPMADENPIPTRSLFDMLLAGGPVLIPIAVCSFVLFVFVFERIVSLRRGRVIPGPFVRRFLQQLREGTLERDEALDLCDENASHIATVFAAAVRKWGRPAVEVEQAILDAGEREGNKLRRYMRVISGVATVSPALGLLGTVWGMMEAFNAIATTDAMGRPELLAGGISSALLTTAAGLCVAIPALIFHLFFVGKADRLIMEIDDLGQQVVSEISMEAIQDRNNKSGSRKKAA